MGEIEPYKLYADEYWWEYTTPVPVATTVWDCNTPGNSLVLVEYEVELLLTEGVAVRRVVTQEEMQELHDCMQ